ncbi:recombinase family protein [Microbacterium sp. G2-8]|uniref:recombinase family protein n=1 Tax=Microbacterium sp. G2-8 TaxID=2842454 RepID=UPI001C891D19
MPCRSRPGSEHRVCRVSTREQTPDAQDSELREAGCSRILVGHEVSSRIADRPTWLRRLDHMRPGDTLVIRALDRIAGSEMLAIQTLHDRSERGIAVSSQSPMRR